MSSIKKTLLAVTAGSLLVAGTAMAMGGHGGKGDCADGNKLDRLSQTLNLTEEQRTQISTIMEQYQTDFDPSAHKAEREAHRAAMQSMMQSDNFDEQAIRDFMESMHAQRIDQQVDHMKMQHEILAVLTPEQQTMLEQMRSQHEFKSNHRRYDRDDDHEYGEHGRGHHEYR